MKRYLEFRDEKSEKFWEVVVAKKIVTTRWGRIGSKGQSNSREYETVAAAERASLKLISEKTKKGYRDKAKTTVKPEPDRSQPRVPPRIKTIQASLDKITEGDGILTISGVVDVAAIASIVSHKNAKLVRQIRQKNWSPISLEKIKKQHGENIAEFNRVFGIDIPDFIFELAHYHECMSAFVKGKLFLRNIEIQGFNTLDMGIFKHVFARKVPVERDALSLRYMHHHLNYFPVFSYGSDGVTQGLILDYQINAFSPFIGWDGDGNYAATRGVWECLLDIFQRLDSLEQISEEREFYARDSGWLEHLESEMQYWLLHWFFGLATAGYVNFHGLPSTGRASKADIRYKEYLDSSDTGFKRLSRNGKLFLTDDFSVYPAMLIELSGNFNPVFSYETLQSFLALAGAWTITPQMVQQFVAETTAGTGDVLELLGLNARQWQAKKVISKRDTDTFIAAVEKFCLDEIEAGRPHLAFLVGLYAWAGVEKQGTERAARLLQKVPDAICHPIIKTVARLHSTTRFDRDIYV